MNEEKSKYLIAKDLVTRKALNLMKQLMMLMKGKIGSGDWDAYITMLTQSGKFRGGSSLGNGISCGKEGENKDVVNTGFMRFEAESIDEVRELLKGNPVYEAGFEVEIHELIEETT